MKLLKPDIYEEAAALLMECSRSEDKNYSALRSGLLRRSHPQEAQEMLEACEKIKRTVTEKEPLKDGLFSFPVSSQWQIGQLLWLLYHDPGSGRKPSEYLEARFLEDEGLNFVKAALGIEPSEQMEKKVLQEALFAAELSETVKYRILEVWLNPHPALTRLSRMVERAAELIRPCLEKYAYLFAYAERFLEQPGAKERLEKRIAMEIPERAELLPLLTGFNMGWDFENTDGEGGLLEKEEEAREVLGVGLLFFVMDSLEGGRIEDAEELTARLKCFTDETKMKILFLLAQQDCYQAEIARRLKLTPATISHHLDMLRNNGIVRSVMRDNRFFYQLQRDRVSVIARALDEALGEHRKQHLPQQA